MTIVSEQAQTTDAFTTEDYTKAMNSIGQNLMLSLAQSIEKLPPPLRNRKIVSQALTGFLANVIYKQFPESPESCQLMLEELNKLTRMQLDQIPTLK